MTQVFQQFGPAGQAALSTDSVGVIALTGGLETLVFVSLFTNKRPPGDTLTERCGWWADTPDDQIGSLLWTLARQVFTVQTLRTAKLYAEQALAWLVTDGLARSVVCRAERLSNDVLAVAVEIAQPTGETYSRLWAVHRENL